MLPTSITFTKDASPMIHSCSKLEVIGVAVCRIVVNVGEREKKKFIGR